MKWRLWRRPPAVMNSSRGWITGMELWEAETADTYIERATYEIARDHRVRVATSDSLEQLIILGHGAVRLSAREFKAEMEAVEGSIREIIARNNRTRGEENTRRRRAVIRGKTGEAPGGT